MIKEIILFFNENHDFGETLSDSCNDNNNNNNNNISAEYRVIRKQLCLLMFA